jgi:protoporphyrinogen/coproporphyrinogen III oxidase
VIAIVGAGITGLALAHHLAARGVPHLVLEAAERPGGVIRTTRVDGHLLEHGPQRTRLVRPVADLVDALGLRDEVITAPAGLPLFVYRRGKLRRVPFSVRDLLLSDIVSLGGKLRALREPFTGAARPGETVAHFLTRKFGRELYENLVGPLYGGLYASDPADMEMDLSLAHVLREFRIDGSLLLALLRRGGTVAPPDACSFAGGLETLVRALHERNRENVRLATPVRRVLADGSGFRVEAEGGVVQAERVVITTPAAAASRMLADVAGDASRRIAELRYNPLAVVHLRADTGLRGLGYQVSLAETLRTRGVTFNDSLFGRTGVHTAYLGGARYPAVVQRSDADVAEIAVREFRVVTGRDADALAVSREWMPAWDRSWRAVEGLSLPRGLHLAANWESRPGIPGRLAQAERLAGELSR